MKRILPGFCLLFFCFFTAFAQSPLYIPYQAVARNAAGNLLVNQVVNLRFTVQQSTSGGSTLYQETQSTTTNSLGLFNVNIGNGTPTSGTFSGIIWGDGQPKFMQVEIDPNGSGYVNMGATQMMSVPYALYAGSAGSAGTIPTGTAGQTLYNNSGTWAATSNLYNNGTTVGIGNTSPNASAILDLTNGTGGTGLGFLPPALATRPTTPTPPNGLIIYNTTNGCLEFYSNGNWQSLSCPCNGAPSIPGSITGSSIATGQSTSTGLCNGSTYAYTILPVAGATSYTWTAPTNTTIYINGQSATSPATTTYTTISLKITGTPSGSLTVSANNACSPTGNTANSGVTLSLLTAPSWTADPAYVGYNQSGVIYTVSSVPQATYNWSVTAITGTASVTSSTTNSTSVSWASNGTQTYTTAYKTASTTVNVTVTGSGGCTASTSTPVTAGGRLPFPENGSAQYWPPSGSYTMYGVTSVYVELWGAGGGGGWDWAGSGGGGAYVQGTLSINAASEYTIIVGQGGVNSSSQSVGAIYGGGGASSDGNSGSGGGRSAIDNSSGTELVTAGGGGGGARNKNNGGATGSNGSFTYVGGGGGATTGASSGAQGAGGVATGGSLASPYGGSSSGTGTQGGLYSASPNGGTGSSGTYGAGGGGGYYGGGGGGDNVNSADLNGGGGGGASFLGALTGVTNNPGATNSALDGTATNPGSTGNDWVSPIGKGGSGTVAQNTNVGGNGYVVVYW